MIAKCVRFVINMFVIDKIIGGNTMRKNVLILFGLVLVYSIFNPLTVHALKTDEEKGSIFLEQAPEELKVAYEDQPFVLSDDLFDENGNLLPILKYHVKYVETSTFRSSMGEEYNLTTEKLLTPEEYSSWKPVQSRATCSEPWGAVDCWETNAKKVYMIVYDWGENNHVKVVVTNLWKTMPSVRSYDSIGLLYNNFTMDTAWGFQYFRIVGDTNISMIKYSYQGQNMKISTTGQKGVSISQNIVNNNIDYLQNELHVEGDMDAYFQAAGSYQHAVTDISLETSKNFTFDAWGMGKVFNWNTSWDQWDNMQGVCLNWSSYLWTC